MRWTARTADAIRLLMPDEDSFHPPDTELEQRARQFAERATNLLDGLKKAEGPSASDSTEALLYFLQSQSCYAELNRREAIRRADRDKKEAEERADQDRKRENRHFRIELIAELVIIALIGWEIRAGGQQAAILEDMKTSTAATAKLQTETLELLRKQEADRAKKPRLVLYVGNTPIDKATVRLTSVAGNPQDMASLDLSVKNLGDAAVSAFQLHMLTPAGAGLIVQGFGIYPEFGPPLPRNAQRWTLQLPQLPVGETKSIQAQVHVLKGHAAFKVAFTADAPELQAVIPLGSLTVLPPQP